MTADSSGPPSGWSAPALKSRRVFHYTSAAGLLGILDTQTLWATEASGLNDRSEVLQGWRLVTKWLERQQEPPEFAAYLRELRHSLPITNVTDTNEVFVLSASREGDDANQWRLYGDNGRGYAIELDATQQLQVATCGQPHADRTRCDGQRVTMDARHLRDSARVSPWSRVVYRKPDRRRVLEDFMQWSETTWAWGERTAGDPDDGPPPSHEARHNIAVAMSSIAQTIKARGFAGENEARTFVSFANGDVHASFRSSVTGIVRHIALTTSPTSSGPVAFGGGEDGKWRLPIRSIRMGPALEPKLAQNAVRSLLTRHGYARDEVSIKRSHVPLR